jgi:RimJ/RimL family protein N-acetyltransferase
VASGPGLHGRGLHGVRLQGVSAETLRALHDGRPDWASLEPGVRATPWPAEDRRMLGYRVVALDDDPGSAPYLLHLILDQDGDLLGRVGCHAAPDIVGAVEIGYFVRRSQRGRGVAGHAVDLFLTWLRGRGVRRVLASVGPTNEPSLRILRRRGFRETGRRIDDEDGEELVLALDL